MKNHCRGFTLVELLISLSIVSMIGLAFFTMINASIKSNVKNEKDIKSLQICQSEVENLRIQIKKDDKNITIHADYLFNNNTIDKNSNNEEIKVSFNNSGKFEVKYVRNLNNDLFLIDMNIDKSDVVLKNGEKEKLYDIYIESSLVGKKNGDMIIEDKEKYLSKKYTKIKTIILSHLISS